MKKTILLSIIVCTNIFATNFLTNSNTLVKVNVESLKIRETPFLNAKVIGTKARESEFLIKGCNDYGWCELEEGGFVPNFTIRADEMFFTYKKEFTKNKNQQAIIKTASLKIYKRPYYKSEIISNTKTKGETILINGCDEYGWCELKDGGYIPSFLVKFTPKEQVKEKVIKQKIEIKTKVISKNKEPIDKKLNKEKQVKDISKKLDIKKTPDITKKPSIKAVNKRTILDDYKEALLLYKEKNYKQSYIKFTELSKKKSDDVNINFYLGRSAFELQKFDEALVSYERVLFEKPEALRTRYEMGRTFFLQNDYKNAKKEFLKIKNDKNTDNNLKVRVDKYLNVIDEKSKKNHFKGAFVFGLGYDSNIKNSSSKDEYNIPDIGNVKNTTTEDSDFFHEEILSLTHTYNYSNDKNINNSFLIYLKNMIEYDDKNVIYLSYNPSLKINHNNSLNSSYGVFIDNIQLDNKNYLTTYGINPKLNYIYSPNLTFETKLKIQEKKYKKEKNRDSLYYELSFANKYLINPANVLALEFKYSKEHRENDIIAINNNAYNIKINNLFIYNKVLSFNTVFSYKKTKYDNINSIFKSKEINDELKTQLITNYIFNPSLFFKFGVNYTKNNSNIPSSDYNKHNLNLNIIKAF